MLLRIAKALNTTPDILRDYHFPAKPSEEHAYTLPSQRDELVAQLKDENKYLRDEISRLHTLLAESLRGGGEVVGSSSYH